MQLYGRAACPQAAETILHLDGAKSFIYTEIIPIEVMISGGGLRASLAPITVTVQKNWFLFDPHQSPKPVPKSRFW